MDYETIYVNCSVYGESPFEVSWLYSTDEISNRSSDYTTISGSKVSNIVYNPSSDDEGYVWWNSSLLLNPINNSTVGYYYCRVNTSFGLIYSKPVYVRNTCKLLFKLYVDIIVIILCIDLPRINFTSFVKSGYRAIGTWRVKSFPLPKILISFQYLSSGSLSQKRVYNDFMTADVSNNIYKTSRYNIDVNKTSDDSLTVRWRHSFYRLFSMRLIAISYDYSSQRAHYHQLYNHSGMSVFYYLKYTYIF